MSMVVTTGMGAAGNGQATLSPEQLALRKFSQQSGVSENSFMSRKDIEKILMSRSAFPPGSEDVKPSTGRNIDLFA